MRTIASISAIKKILFTLRGRKKVGFVPTMGALHDGHLSLMRTARQECDYVVVSIFVNPLQFGQNEDYDRYPRDNAGDRKKAATAGVDLLWMPQADEILPADAKTFVTVDNLSDLWEGAERPGHFRGVATIVTELFQIVKPDIAYFGQKDYQQTVIIRQLIRDLHFDIKVRVLPTVREGDGMAQSSRNRFLSPEDRQAAAVLYRALRQVEQEVKKGNRRCDLLQKSVESLLANESRVKVDYVAFCDPNRLTPVLQIGRKTVILLAARVGSVRLIDNITVGLK